ncbi:MAG: DMT family transporter [SAR324 cluster bacterium]|nr:DMT family transporter [SAR324 cluster bacterium]
MLDTMNSYFLWISLTLACSVILGVYKLSKKVAVHKNEPIAVSFFTATFAALPGLLLLLHALWFNDDRFIRGLSLPDHALIFIKSLIVSSSWILSYIALKFLPLSLASPLRESTPLWTITGAFLIFHEEFTFFQVIGMGVGILAYYRFSMIGKLEGIRFTANKWVLLMAISAVLGSTSSLYDKYLLQSKMIHVQTFQTWFYLYNSLLIGLVCLVTRHKSVSFKFKPSIIITGLLLFFADLFYFYAVSTEGAMISVIAMLRRASIIIPFFASFLIFKEKYIFDKSIALLFFLVGTVFIILGAT